MPEDTIVVDLTAKECIAAGICILEVVSTQREEIPEDMILNLKSFANKCMAAIEAQQQTDWDTPIE